MVDMVIVAVVPFFDDRQGIAATVETQAQPLAVVNDVRQLQVQVMEVVVQVAFLLVVEVVDDSEDRLGYQIEPRTA